MNTKSEKISKIDTFLDKTDKKEREDTNRQLQKRKETISLQTLQTLK